MTNRLRAALSRAPASTREQDRRAWCLAVVLGLIVVLGAPCCVHAETCIASHYGVGDGLHGSRTASGERFNAYAMTAAHRTRPLGSHVTVTHAGRSVTVRINDRGPFVRGRCIDLSYGAARALGIGGTARVDVQ